MKTHNDQWHISRQLGVSVFVQLVLLASLIIGTWVNLQRQLCLLQNNIEQLISVQQKFQEKVESLNTMCIGYEYRLQAIEKDEL